MTIPQLQQALDHWAEYSELTEADKKWARELVEDALYYD